MQSAPTIVLCPGVHSPNLTQSFRHQLAAALRPTVRTLIFPSDRYPAYSTPDVLRFLHEELNGDRSPDWQQIPIIWIGFSAGVVGAMGAAIAWELLGGNVQALFALDGWGVPAIGNFPVHRLSHDYFTHWSSALLGTGQDSFYADPEVEHLALWRSPQAIQGYWISAYAKHQSSLLQFLVHWLNFYSTKA